MSVKSFNHERSSFTPYQDGLEQKELSLFSRLNLNENDKNSLQHPMRSFAEYDSSDLFSMRSKKRKGSAEIQLKESLPGNKTYLNVSLVGKSSMLNNDIFGHEHYQDLGLGEQYFDQKQEFSQKSCPVGPSYIFQQQFDQSRRNRQLESKLKPRFHKTKNMLRTIGSYLHKFILHNKRSNMIKQKYFHKVLIKILEKQESQQKMSLQIFKNIKIGEEESNQSQQSEIVVSRSQRKKGKKEPLQKSTSEQILLPRDKETQNKKHPYLFQDKVKKQIKKEQIQQKIQQFDSWVQNLSMINFADYQRVWLENHEFTPLYRQICYKYYKEEVFCDVMRSRLTTKEITMKYMYQFIEGLFNPKQFYRFK